MMFPVFTQLRLSLDTRDTPQQAVEEKGVGSADGIECNWTVHTTSTFQQNAKSVSAASNLRAGIHLSKNQALTSRSSPAGTL
jgi:hypothetical protein